MLYIEKCEVQAWHLETWPKNGDGEHQCHPYRCGSWRHAGDCRLHKAQQDYSRIRDAIASRTHWLHVVLTYPTWTSEDVKALYRQGLHDWAKLRKRTKTRYGEYKYIQVWERTRKGYPHCHMAVSCERLFSECGSDPIRNFHNQLRDAAVECGFGKIGWCERIDSPEIMSKYLSKLCEEISGNGKDYQTPTNAPKNFRRLRASVRLLPPIRKNPDMTGVLRLYALDGEVK